MANYTSHNVVTRVAKKENGDYGNPVYLGAEQRFVNSLLNSHVNNLEEQFILGVDNITAEWTNSKNIRQITKKFYDGVNINSSAQGYYILFSSDYSSATSRSTAPIAYDEILDPRTGKLVDVISIDNVLTGKEGEGATFAEADKQTVLIDIISEEGVEDTALIDENDILIFNLTKNYALIGEQTAAYYSGNDDTIVFDASSVEALFDLIEEGEEEVLKLSSNIDTDINISWYKNSMDAGDEGFLYIDPSYIVTREDTLCFRTDINDLSDVQNESDIVIAVKTVSQKYDDNRVKRVKETIENKLLYN